MPGLLHGSRSNNRQFLRARVSPKQKTRQQIWRILLFSVGLGLVLVGLAVGYDAWWGRLDPSTLLLPSSSSSSLLSMQDASNTQKKTTIAVATSLTQCPEQDIYRTFLIDTAAVLRHSIDIMAQQSKYQYECFVFVHPEAVNCTATLRQAGFQVLVRETPVDVAQIQNQVYRDQMVKSGCCGEKEFLKLYAYTLHDYPVVLHLDMDMILLKPYDDVIDAFLTPKVVGTAMWPTYNPQGTTNHIGIAFTRDYSTGIPGRPVERYNVQGGFLMVRPNQTTFDELIHLVLQGNFNNGWYDGKVKYPKWYGGETIQGLLAFYYGHYHPDKALELDRCVHNAMAEPQRDKHNNACYSVVNKTTGECHRDCQLVNITEIYSIHYTNCGKSYRCFAQNHFQWNKRAKEKSRLCLDFHEEWFRLRDSLDVQLGISSQPNEKGADRTFGHCDFSKAEENVGPHFVDTDRYRPINWTMAQQSIGK